jgi:mannan endo-1,4-beta-mannosidase
MRSGVALWRLAVAAGLVALTTAATAAPAAAQSLSPPKVKVGVALSSAQEVPAYVSRVVKPDYVDLYVPWSRQEPFDTGTARSLQRLGIGYKVTWEPWDPSASKTTQPAFTLKQIIAGRHDAYVKRWARGAAAFGHPVTVRLMHEANGRWYPWSPGVNTNTATEYRRAWQRVVTMVRQQGARNVRWEWAPNQLYDGSSALRPLWPGDGYVDSVGISGYNWGLSNPWTRWTPFRDLWPKTIADIRTFTKRPVGIAETGSVGSPADKADWVTDMFAGTTGLSSITYFNVRRPEADWRVEVHPEVLRAYRLGFMRTR